MYIDKLDDAVNKSNNTSHSTMKIKPADINSSTYTDFNKENNKEAPEFEIDDCVRISKYKNIFAKGYTPNWPEEVLELENLNIPFRGHMLLLILTVNKLLERFTKNNFRQQIKKSLE